MRKKNPGTISPEIFQGINQYKSLLQYFFIIFIFLPFFSCKEKAKPPSSELIIKYQENAHRFCTAVVECFKKDAEKRLEEDPERAKLITSKMDMDLCHQNQYKMIGQTSVSINQTDPSNDAELYRTYENCAVAVSTKENCDQRLETYRTNPDCKKIKHKI